MLQTFAPIWYKELWSQDASLFCQNLISDKYWNYLNEIVQVV